MLLHRCKCGALIPQELRLCPDCEAKESDKMSRHMEYNLRRRNKKAGAFALSLYDSLDMYAYYVQHKIVVADMVHHITEIEEDWTQRLNVENLFPLSNGNHGIISALYKKDEATKRQTQELLRNIIQQHWKGVGGIEKVLTGLD